VLKSFGLEWNVLCETSLFSEAL
jgi:hypothetical protein